MRIFKFGGASVKDAKGVKNVVNVLQNQGIENVLVVISAMGKMTNAFENVSQDYFNKKHSLKDSLVVVENFHKNILTDLFEPNHPIYDKVNCLFDELKSFMAENKSDNYNYIYDQIVGFGELLSTNIVSAYLTKKGVSNHWLDVRNCIETDANHRDAKVNWKQTQVQIKRHVIKNMLNITQGFLGSSDTKTTTLGREGSDYTAGIFAYCLDAKSVTIWKDVDGVLNADPRVFAQTTLLHKISYTEAIEMAFYGASVIHPKTIQPLEQKNIPLFVRSFEKLSNKGTCIARANKIMPEIPCFIVKKNQIVISIAAKDFSFMVENNISYVFEKLYKFKLKVNLIQNSAISFSVCVDDKYHSFDAFYQELKTNFKIKSYKDATLYTIRHFDQEAVYKIRQKGKVIISQINTETAQLVVL